jgi:hypothetical protein
MEKVYNIRVSVKTSIDEEGNEYPDGVRVWVDGAEILPRRDVDIPYYFTVHSYGPNEELVVALESY